MLLFLLVSKYHVTEFFLSMRLNRDCWTENHSIRNKTPVHTYHSWQQKSSLPHPYMGGIDHNGNHLSRRFVCKIKRTYTPFQELKFISRLLANIPSGNNALNNFSFMQITEGPEYGWKWINIRPSGMPCNLSNWGNVVTELSTPALSNIHVVRVLTLSRPIQMYQHSCFVIQISNNTERK